MEYAGLRLRLGTLEVRHVGVLFRSARSRAEVIFTGGSLDESRAVQSGTSGRLSEILQE